MSIRSVLSVAVFIVSIAIAPLLTTSQVWADNDDKAPNNKCSNSTIKHPGQ